MKVGEIERALFGFASIQPEYPCWMANGDAGPSYCFACATKKAAETGDEVDGGYRRYENDGCCHCDICGVLLDYTLTEYGVSEELDHYERRRFRAPLHPEDAYHVGCLLRDAPENPNVIRVAKRFVAKLTSMGAIAP